MIKFLAVTAILAFATAAAVPLAAQDRSVVSSAALEAAVISAPGSNQAAVQRFLASDRVTDAAEQMGVQSSALAAAVRLLDEQTLSQIAERTRAAELGLAGGDRNVVISTTAIIIILLILILVLN